MTVKDNLKILLLNYPELFPNAFSVYHHWFCVNGNGYEWKNGELVNAYDNNLEDVEKSVTNQVDSRMTDFEIKKESRFSTSFHFYPLCKYAKICNIPDDIKNDWLLAAKKMIDIMDKNREYFNRDCPDELDFFEKAQKRIYEILNHRHIYNQEC